MNETINEQDSSLVKEALQKLEKINDFQIVPYEEPINLNDTNRFKKIKLNSAQKIQISALAQNALPMVATGVMANVYVAKFPAGLPHTLMKLNQGGFGSIIQENGKILGTASFYPLTTQATVLGAFTAMSIASGQYFLSQINNEMKMMHMKLDEILEFLYGDKKAELMAEMSFVQSTYQNYDSIMSHEQQRIATLVSLQEAKKVAMKDIEFYMHDLDSLMSKKTKDYAEIQSKTEKAFQIKESLILAQQLFIMSSLLEVYFAQNQDTEYLDFVEKNLFAYIDKCDKRMLGDFGVLKGIINNYKARPMEKINKPDLKKPVNHLIDSLANGEESAMRKTISLALHASTKNTEYYINKNGEVYISA